MKEKREMRLHKYVLLGATAIVAMAAMTGVALGTTHANTGPSALATASGGVKVAVANTALGRVLVDGRGRTLYLFGKDKHGRSAAAGNAPASGRR